MINNKKVSTEPMHKSLVFLEKKDRLSYAIGAWV